eukprot:gb/GECH01005910.1/.p1 GENE.gb/GECH01005910.1/~~gb/GECH01005910.1/.p1  ORF type:complete len:2384 (+),score=392.02 gb/GECH01005910.1/:1-7152(+)
MPSHEGKDPIAPYRVVEQGLRIAEILLRDDARCGILVGQQGGCMGRVLGLLEGLTTEADKRKAVRIVALLGRYEHNRREIGRLDGFRRILDLLESHPGMKKDILHAMRYFLDLSGVRERKDHTTHKSDDGHSNASSHITDLEQKAEPLPSISSSSKTNRRIPSEKLTEKNLQGEPELDPTIEDHESLDTSDTHSSTTIAEFARHFVAEFGRLLSSASAGHSSSEEGGGGNRWTEGMPTERSSRRGAAVFPPPRLMLLEAVHRVRHRTQRSTMVASEQQQPRQHDGIDGGKPPPSDVPIAVESRTITQPRTGPGPSSADADSTLHPNTSGTNTHDEESRFNLHQSPPPAHHSVSATTWDEEEERDEEDRPIPVSQVQDLMGVQGALPALTHSLSGGTLSVQLDLVNTISKLVYQNLRNQQEMARIDGYQLFPRLFAMVEASIALPAAPATYSPDPRTPSSVPSSSSSRAEIHRFLRECFGCIYSMVIDGRPNAEIGNLDAFLMLGSLLHHRHALVVRRYALDTLHDIVVANPAVNAFYLSFTGVWDRVLGVFLQCIPGAGLPSVSTSVSPLYSSAGEGQNGDEKQESQEQRDRDTVGSAARQTILLVSLVTAPVDTSALTSFIERCVAASNRGDDGNTNNNKDGGHSDSNGNNNDNNDGDNNPNYNLRDHRDDQHENNISNRFSLPPPSPSPSIPSAGFCHPDVLELLVDMISDLRSRNVSLPHHTVVSTLLPLLPSSLQYYLSISTESLCSWLRSPSARYMIRMTSLILRRDPSLCIAFHHHYHSHNPCPHTFPFPLSGSVYQVIALAAALSGSTALTSLLVLVYRTTSRLPAQPIALLLQRHPQPSSILPAVTSILAAAPPSFKEQFLAHNGVAAIITLLPALAAFEALMAAASGSEAVKVYICHTLGSGERKAGSLPQKGKPVVAEGLVDLATEGGGLREAVGRVERQSKGYRRITRTLNTQGDEDSTMTDEHREHDEHRARSDVDTTDPDRNRPNNIQEDPHIPFRSSDLLPMPRPLFTMCPLPRLMVNGGTDRQASTGSTREYSTSLSHTQPRESRQPRPSPVPEYSSGSNAGFPGNGNTTNGNGDRYGSDMIIPSSDPPPGQYGTTVCHGDNAGYGGGDGDSNRHPEDIHPVRVAFLSRVVLRRGTWSLHILPHSPLDVQMHTVHVLSALVLARPANQYSLPPSAVSKALASCPPELRTAYAQLAAVVGVHGGWGLHTVRDLVRRGVEEQDDAELRMQWLYVAGQVCEAVRPRRSLHFDGHDGHVCLGPLERFPDARTGYSIGMWVRVAGMAYVESSLLSWHDVSRGTVVRLFVMKNHPSPATSACSLAMTAITDNVVVASVVFDQIQINEGGAWHHILVSHDSDTVTICLDGGSRHRHQSCSFPVYPRPAGSRDPVVGYLACTMPPQPSSARILDVASSIEHGGVFHGQMADICVTAGAAADLQHWYRTAWCRLHYHPEDEDISALDPHDGTVEPDPPLSHRVEREPTIRSRGSGHGNSKHEGSKTHASLEPVLADIPRSETNGEVLVRVCQQSSGAPTMDDGKTDDHDAKGSARIGSVSAADISPHNLEGDSTHDPPRQNSSSPIEHQQQQKIPRKPIQGHTTQKQINKNKEEEEKETEEQPVVLVKGGVLKHFPEPLPDGAVLPDTIRAVSLGGGAQVAALRLIIGLYQHSPGYRHTFNASSGFPVLHHLLATTQGDIMEGVHIIVDGLGGPESAFIHASASLTNDSTALLSHADNVMSSGKDPDNRIQLCPPAVALLLALILDTTSNSVACRSNLLSLLADLLLYPPNIEPFRNTFPGTPGLLRLLLQPDLPSDMASETARTVELLVSDGNDTDTPSLVESAITTPDPCLPLLYRLSQTSPSLLNALRPHHGGPGVLLPLAVMANHARSIHSETEYPVHPPALGIAALLLQDADTLSSFARSGGFDFLLGQLHTQAPTLSAETSTAILDLTAPHTFTSPDNAHPARITLSLIAAGMPSEAAVAVLSQIHRLLGTSLSRPAVICQHPIIDWVSPCLHESTPAPVREHLGQILRIVVSAELSQPSRDCRLWRLREHGATCVVETVRAAVDVVEGQPRIEGGHQAVRNLAGMLAGIQLTVTLPAEVCLAVIGMINTLSSYNTASIRSRMKSERLYEVRDALIVHMLRPDLPIPIKQRHHVLTRIPVESIAGESIFRDGGGMALLLTSIPDIPVELRAPLMTLIARIMQSSSSANKSAAALLGNSNPLLSRIQSSAQLLDSDTESESMEGSESDDGPVSLSDPIAEIVEWVYDENQSQIHHTLRARIPHTLSTVETAQRKARDRVLSRVAKRSRVRQSNSSTKQIAATARKISDIEGKCTQFLENSVRSHKERMESVDRWLKEWLDQGVKTWSYLSAS